MARLHFQTRIAGIQIALYIIQQSFVWTFKKTTGGLLSFSCYVRINTFLKVEQYQCKKKQYSDDIGSLKTK